MRTTANARYWICASLVSVLAAGYQLALASDPTNDDYLHIVLGGQVLAGDWPVRDFFDSGLALMFWLSAAAEAVVGHRLLAEGVIVGTALGVSAFLTFRLVHRLTGSVAAGALAATLLMLASVRGYSYPKIVAYAVAASIWWSYVRSPTRAKAVAMGAWTAVAFYWRPDHGVYVAISVMLAAWAAHGVSRLGAVRLAQAGATAIALVTPFLVYVAAVMGLEPYVKGGLAVAEAQHMRLNNHSFPRWPIRRAGDVIGIDPRETAAPIIGLRWTPDSPPAARSALLARYHLTPLPTDDPAGQRVRMSPEAIDALPALVGESIVEDTAGVNRSQSRLDAETWPFWQRWQFSQWWLRINLFPGLDDQPRASEGAAALFYVLPLATLLLAPWLRRRLPDSGSTANIVAFGLFGVVSAFGLTRTPYDVRAVDGVVIPAILLGLWTTALWRWMPRRTALRWVAVTASLLLAVVTVKSVTVAGHFPSRVSWLAGEWRSPRRALGAWNEAVDLLTAEPALSYWDGRGEPPEIRLSRYVRECVAPGDRLLVLWFAPEIYYYSERLMANRNLAFLPGIGAPGEQEMTLAKISRYAPPIALATDDDRLEEYYPAVVDYIQREYVEEASFDEDGQHFRILRRRDRPASRSYGEAAWPCTT